MKTLSPLSSISKTPQGRVVRVTWLEQRPAPHEFEAIAYPEEEGGFSVYAQHFPGVVSQGETIDEAKANIAEAFLAMLEAHRKGNESMGFSLSAWQDTPNNSIRFRVKVDG